MRKKIKKGRPLKITPFIVQKLEEAASVDASIAEMCFHADIAKGTYYAAIKRDPHLLYRLENLRQKPTLQARITQCRAVAHGDVHAAQWYLERKRKAEFAARSEVTGAEGAPLGAESLGKKVAMCEEASALAAALVAKLSEPQNGKSK